ncbi:ATP-binding cassette domain-containing protein [Campylobacter sp. RM12642]|uniref:methionine ABC transporter ATP-binding protein n=1 Tax=unclassified Campylobacter TaxID=2593542 RepID=UPI001DC24ED3|nr:ATP-binding cassette domain-containing protein [Campylobacter sp. RM12642]MBZ8007926.1 ATP-binding cassette domain-containing protein [Campylobacter sp. RM9334]
MIVVKNLNKFYNNNKILNNISFKINDGKICAILGKSGSGKSTLLSCINGLEKFQSGEIYIDNQLINTLDEKALRIARKNIGMIFQNYILISRKNVYDNIALPMQCWGYDKNIIDLKVKSLAKLVGLFDKLYVKPNELSGGQKQRVAIARALSLEPKYLLCDECTSALDEGTTESILKLLKELNEKLNITIIIVTHEMNVVRAICDEIYYIKNGEISNLFSASEFFLNDDFRLNKSGLEFSLYIKNYEKYTQIFYDLSKILNNPYEIISTNYHHFNNTSTMQINISINEIDKNTFLDLLKSLDITYKQKDDNVW